MGRWLKQIGIIIWFLCTPFVLAWYHIDQISFEKTINTFSINRESIRVDKNLDSIQNRPHSNNKNYQIKSDEVFQGFDQMFRFSQLLNIPYDVVRHVVYLKHDLMANVKYSYQGVNSKDSRKDTFPLELICKEKLVGADKNEMEKIVSNLKLNEPNDREIIEYIINECLYGGNVTFRNKTGLDMEISPDDVELLTNSGVTLKMEPDSISKIILHVGWLIFWIGSCVLIKEGPIKYLKEASKNNKS